MFRIAGWTANESACMEIKSQKFISYYNENTDLTVGQCLRKKSLIPDIPGMWKHYTDDEIINLLNKRK